MSSLKILTSTTHIDGVGWCEDSLPPPPPQTSSVILDIFPIQKAGYMSYTGENRVMTAKERWNNLDNQ